MSMRERDKLHVIRNILEGRITQSEAAKILRRSERHVRRLCARCVKMVHVVLSTGCVDFPPNNRLDEEVMGRALSALHDPMREGFGPTFAQQKLDELYDIMLGAETVRKLLILTNLWQARRRGAAHRAWRVVIAYAVALLSWDKRAAQAAG